MKRTPGDVDAKLGIAAHHEAGHLVTAGADALQRR